MLSNSKQFPLSLFLGTWVYICYILITVIALYICIFWQSAEHTIKFRGTMFDPNTHRMLKICMYFYIWLLNCYNKFWYIFTTFLPITSKRIDTQNFLFQLKTQRIIFLTIYIWMLYNNFDKFYIYFKSFRR